jgi:hypothetical protein
MEASVVGSGLVLAMYALIIPMAHRIFEERVRDLKSMIVEFENLKSKITPESNDKEMNKLNNLRLEIKEVTGFPFILGVGVVITFVLYFFSTMLDSTWLISASPAEGLDLVLTLVFWLATISFLFLGLGAISNISVFMKKEFEETTKKQKEIGSNPTFK